MDDNHSDHAVKNLLDVAAGCESEEDCSWVFVEKQKITILVPPLSPKNQHQATSTPESQQKPRRKPQRNTPVQVRRADPTKTFQQTTMSSKPQQNASNISDVEPTVMDVKHTFGKSRSLRAVGLRRRPLTIGSLEVLNLQLRATNLKRHLSRVGGLRSWLASLGLERFAKILEKNKLNNFHLVRLTMEKLKDMGVYEVGPRRKLLHAINSISKPYVCKN